MSELNEKELYRIVGKNIANVRQLRNESQQKIANDAKINRATLSNIESGKQNVSLHIVYAIAKALKTQVTSFLPAIENVPNQEKENQGIEDILDNESIDESTKNTILNIFKSSEDDK